MLTSLQRGNYCRQICHTNLTCCTVHPWQGALSTVEKLLPLADKFGAISLLKTFVNVSPGVLQTGAVSPTSPSPTRISPPPPALEATQGQIDGFFSQLPYKCYQNQVAYVGD